MWFPIPNEPHPDKDRVEIHDIPADGELWSRKRRLNMDIAGIEISYQTNSTAVGKKSSKKDCQYCGHEKNT